MTGRYRPVRRLVSVAEDLRNLVDGVAERVVFEDLATTVYGAENLARYLFAAHWAAGRKVVDLCCGTGYGTNVLLAAGAAAARGIDVSQSAIGEAQLRFGRPGLEFAVGDANSPLDLGDAGLRVCFEGLEHVSDAGALLDNLVCGLPDDGCVIVSTPNGDLHPSGHSGNPHHVREYGLADFGELMRERFQNVQMYFQWRYPDPHDIEWSATEIARALVPVGVKRGLGTLGRGRVANVSAAPAPHEYLAVEFRPLPATYLRLPPGLRYGQPMIWIAVCRTT